MRTHPFQAVSLIFGLLFVAAGVVFLSGDVDLWQLNAWWFWPGVLIVAGLLVLFSARTDAAARQRHEHPPADDVAVDHVFDDDADHPDRPAV